MREARLDVVILGLSITSSWGNGHATTFRALTRALAQRGHRLLFLERDTPWYAAERDLAAPPWCPTHLYQGLEELVALHARAVAGADLVIVGSYVPDGAAVGHWVCDTAQGVTAFYDIDTPVTLQGLTDNGCEYLTHELIPRYDLFLSFAGGPLLERLEEEFGAAMARPLHCCVDAGQYAPAPSGASAPHLDLGYMGTYSADRQPKLERLLLEPARDWPGGRFAVAGPMYPEIDWPANVARTEHIPPDQHRAFYNSQRYTLNLTRADMTAVGYSPSVRLFEAAACVTAIITDHWEGLESFFRIGEELLVAETRQDVLRILRTLPEERRLGIGAAARRRILSAHTADQRAAELEQHYLDCLRRQRRRRA